MSVDEIRLAEASAIVQAYRDRLASQRYKLELTKRQNGDVLRAMRHIRATLMELLDAEGYEARCRDRLHAPTTPPRKRRSTA